MSLPLALQGGGGPATITADLAATEAQDVAAFSATLVHVAALAVTEAPDTAAFSAVRLSVGTLAATEGQDLASFSATLAHTAALAVLEAQDIAAFSGVLVHVADLAATEGQDVAAFSASIEEPTAEERRGGKGDNKRGDAKRRSIVKPTGLTHKKRKAHPTIAADEQGDAGQAVPSGADEEAADAFIEQLRETPFAQTPVAQMSMEQIEREIAALLHKNDLASDDEMLLVILLAAAATA